MSSAARPVVDKSVVDNLLAQYEKGFNVAGYFSGLFSILNTFSPISLKPGYYRAMFGTLEAVTGIALVGINGTKALFTLDGKVREQNLTNAMSNLVYTAHGFANIVRGTIESTLPLGLGGLAGLVWDYSNSRFNYDGEEKGSGVPITMEMLTEKVEWLRSNAQRAWAVYTAASAPV